jgi:hypothetical protein
VATRAIKWKNTLGPNLRKARAKLRQAVAQALQAEAEIEKTESMRRTPVDTGNLRATHIVTKPEIHGDRVTVRIAVGGPSAPYALRVHEDLQAFHRVGQAKFLESTLKESAPFMATRIARRLQFDKVFR